MAYIKTPADRPSRIKAGQAIIRLSNSVFKTAPSGQPPTEWQKFVQDPGAWLYDLGYRLEGPNAPADGRIPPEVLEIVPVYDGKQRMHLRIPYAGDLDPSVPLPDATEYANSFEAFLASYFTRRCR